MTQDEYDAAAYRIAKAARIFIDNAAKAEGVPLTVAVFGVHSQVSAMLTLMVGGEEAAEIMRKEALGIEGHLSAAEILSEMTLAKAEPKGRA